MGNDSGTNPAWKPFLDVLPESLHNLVIPVLKQWDQGVQQKFQDIRNEYSELEGFKKFVENNIDPEYVEQAVILADQLQREPAKIVGQINEAWNLGYVSKEDAAKLGQSSQNDGDLGDLGLGDPDNDIFKDPRVAAMKQALDELQNNFQSDKQREEEERATQEFEEYLDELEQSYTDPNRDGGPLPFNRMFVTALISQGIDGEAAVKQYHEALAVNVTAPDNTPTPPSGTGDQPPVVMGGEGSTGSGSPDGAVNFGSLSKNDLNATVQQLLAKAQEQGN
jgi:hypothetical protein